MDRACGVDRRAGAERQFGGCAGGSDHRVRVRRPRQAGLRESSPGRTGTCGSRRSTPARSARSIPATGAISEFATPTPNSSPLGITTGPDGNLWFTEFAADKIGEINPSTHAITEFAIPTASAFPVALVDRTKRERLVHRRRRGQDRRDQPHHARDQRVHGANREQPAVRHRLRTRWKRLVHREEREQDRRVQPEHQHVHGGLDHDPNVRAQRHLGRPRRHPVVHRASECREPRRTDRPHDPRDHRVPHPDADGRPGGHHPRRRREHVVHRRSGQDRRDQRCHEGDHRGRCPDGVLQPGRYRPGLRRKPVVHRGRRCDGSVRLGQVRPRPSSVRP